MIDKSSGIGRRPSEGNFAGLVAWVRLGATEACFGSFLPRNSVFGAVAGVKCPCEFSLIAEFLNVLCCRISRIVWAVREGLSRLEC